MTRLILSLAMLVAASTPAAAQTIVNPINIRLQSPSQLNHWQRTMDNLTLGFSSTPTIFGVVAMTGALVNADSVSWRITAYAGGSVSLTVGISMLVPALSPGIGSAGSLSDELVPLGITSVAVGVLTLTTAIIGSERSRRARREPSILDSLSVSPGSIVTKDGAAPSLLVSGRF